MAKTITCTVKGAGQASNLVERLTAMGFDASEISVLLPGSKNSENIVTGNQSSVPEGAALGASTGAAVGGELGWLAGIGSIAIPGVGQMIAAGPIMAALAGVAAGASVGGASGALIGMGIPEVEATRYMGKLNGGRCLISVHVEDSAELARARQILELEGAEDVTTSSHPVLRTTSNR